MRLRDSKIRGPSPQGANGVIPAKTRPASRRDLRIEKMSQQFAVGEIVLVPYVDK